MNASAARRQWQGGRREDEEDDESEYTSSHDTRNQSSGISGTAASGGGKASSVGPPPAFNGDRSAGAWEEYRIRARLWLQTTTIDEKSRGPRMLQALTGQAFEAMKFLADSDEWMNNPQNGRILLEEMAKPAYFGKEELESLWSALQKLFYTRLRNDDDDLTTFRNKFDDAVRKIRKHHVDLPDSALGFLYLKQLRVDAFALERIITRTNGNLELSSVIAASRKLKMRLIDEGEDRKKQLWIQDMMETEGNGNQDIDPGDEELEILENALQELEGDPESLNEDEAKEVLMNLIKQKVVQPGGQHELQTSPEHEAGSAELSWIQIGSTSCSNSTRWTTSPGLELSQVHHQVQELSSSWTLAS